MPVKPEARFGVDVGGTFTDAVVFDTRTGSIHRSKILTTPNDPSIGALAAFKHVREQARSPVASIRHIMHATTVATNSIIERTGPPTALLVTEGFRDILEIGRQVRHELYNLQTDKPSPLVPRRYCYEVKERLDADGNVLIPVDRESVASTIREIRNQGILSIAVCFLHAFRNPVHEHMTADIIRAIYPQSAVSISSDVAPEIREYWRASTTVINAYLKPVVGKYVAAMARGLAREGATAPFYLMQSNGGLMTPDVAIERPVFMVESGPAAGVAAASYFSESTGLENCISFDMGGTTAKMGLVLGGKPRLVSEVEVGAGPWSGSLTKGSGYPILGSVVDLVEVGAGGGSVAWVDEGGGLRVGPRSSGADPGPAAYGRGGELPTVTDAHLILGRLSPTYFLGGEMRLDVAAAQQAIRSRCAEPLGMDVHEAAMGVLDIVNSRMAQAVRLVSVQRGYDPRQFALVAFGGAGPLHANSLASQMGIPYVVVPPYPGIASAFGLLATDLRHDYRRTLLRRFDESALVEASRAWDEFEESARQIVGKEGVLPEEMAIIRYLDMRYVGQSWNLRIPVRGRAGPTDEAADLRSRFEADHEMRYGFSVENEPLEIAAVGLVATRAIRRRITLSGTIGAGKTRVSGRAAMKGTRQVYFRETSGFEDCPVYERYLLAQGIAIEGPAVIEETDSTTIIQPGYHAAADQHGILHIEKL